MQAKGKQKQPTWLDKIIAAAPEPRAAATDSKSTLRDSVSSPPSSARNSLADTPVGTPVGTTPATPASHASPLSEVSPTPVVRAKFSEVLKKEIPLCTAGSNPWEPERPELSSQVMKIISGAFYRDIREETFLSRAVQLAKKFYEAFKSDRHLDPISTLLSVLSQESFQVSKDTARNFEIRCHVYRFFLEEFPEVLRSDTGFKEAFFTKYNEFVKQNKERFHRARNESIPTDKVVDVGRQAEICAIRAAQRVCNMLGNKKDLYLSPFKDNAVTEAFTDLRGETTPNGKWWIRAWGVVFLPMGFMEMILRFSIVRQYVKDNKIAKFFDGFLKVIFWPEPLIKEFPRYKWPIRLLHFLPWLLLAIFVPPLLGGVSVAFMSAGFGAFAALMGTSAVILFSALAITTYVGARLLVRAGDTYFRQPASIESGQPVCPPSTGRNEILYDTTPGRTRISIVDRAADNVGNKAARRLFSTPSKDGSPGGVVGNSESGRDSSVADAKGNGGQQAAVKQESLWGGPLTWFGCCGGGRQDEDLGQGRDLTDAAAPSGPSGLSASPAAQSM